MQANEKVGFEAYVSVLQLNTQRPCHKKMANLSASPIFLTHEATQQKRDSVYHNQLGPRPRQRLEATKVATGILT